jgi:hypothetical protein
MQFLRGWFDLLDGVPLKPLAYCVRCQGICTGTCQQEPTRQYDRARRNDPFHLVPYARNTTHNWHTGNRSASDFMPACQRGRLIGRQSSILVEPFSSLHHQCVAWILSGWSSLQGAICKAVENDCLTKGGELIRPCVPSHVAYEVGRRGNNPSEAPRTMHLQPQG